jgi:hypothetical protein
MEITIRLDENTIDRKIAALFCWVSREDKQRRK